MHDDIHWFDFAPLEQASRLADFQLAVLDIAFKDAGASLADTDELEQFLFGGSTEFSFLHGILESVFHQTGGRELPEVQQGAAFVEIEAQGPYTILEPGKKLDWTVRWYLATDK